VSNYIALVFKSESKAHEALRMLWRMDESGDLTVHGAAVVRRDNDGFVEVASKHTDAGMRTAVGIGAGILLGALAGPIGAAAGFAVASAGTAIGVGAAVGGAIGLTADAIKSEDRADADLAALYKMHNGEYAVVADLSEEWPYRLDDAVKVMGGVIHRKYDAYIGNEYASNYLYPYYYDSAF
jgi:uncharacterized membrane protein